MTAACSAVLSSLEDALVEILIGDLSVKPVGEVRSLNPSVSEPSVPMHASEQ